MSATAEMGKTRTVPVDKLKAGMKVHADIMGRGGKVLVSAGEVLTKKHCDKLAKWEKREKPLGPQLKKQDPKNPNEPVRRAEFEGGYRPSHFNPRGVPVSTTLASGEEVPAVERDPSLSPLLKDKPDNMGKGTFQAPDIGVESPLFRQRALQSEIKVLERTNAKLGGDLHSAAGNWATEAELTERRDALEAQNDSLIKGVSRAANPKRAGGKKGSKAVR